MGENMIDAGDFTGDGKDDLIVGMPNVPDPNLSHVSGRVLFVNGVTGEVVKTVSPPPEPSHIGADTDFGARVAKLGDIGSCSALFCSTVGPPDGLPDFAVSAPGADISLEQYTAEQRITLLEEALDLPVSLHFDTALVPGSVD